MGRNWFVNETHRNLFCFFIIVLFITFFLLLLKRIFLKMTMRIVHVGCELAVADYFLF